MIKKILTHIIFFLILEIICILFSAIYSSRIDISGSLVWNLVLTFILFCLNLIENRKFKWIIIIAFVCIPHLALTILGAGEEGNEPLAGDMVDLLVEASPGNIPFLPWFQLGFESRILNKIIYYIMFFYGPLLYWYFAYRGSKKIVSKFWNDQESMQSYELRPLMKKKILIHIIFLLILEIVYILFSAIYSKDIYFFGSLMWNIVLTSILFCLNLIESKRNKWIAIAVICSLHLLLTILSVDKQLFVGDMVYLLVSASSMNIPFLSWVQLSFESLILNKIIYYIMFFYGPLLYWYCTYQGSKKIVSKFWND